MARYQVRGNGAGGYCIIRRRGGKICRIGSECSHRSNADIIASRLNGDRDQAVDWITFYRAGTN